MSTESGMVLVPRDALSVINDFAKEAAKYSGTEMLKPYTSALDAALAAAPASPPTHAVDDTARLNWLEEREAHLVSHRESFGVDDPECEWTIWWNVTDRKGKKSISGHPLGSVRDAIDFAMENPK